MRIGTVSRLWRYAVKSMAGERLGSARLTRSGFPGDRGWAVYDETRDGVTGAKRLPPLRAWRGRYPSEPVAGAAPPPAELTSPDGVSVLTDSPNAARHLSERLGRPVTLRALGPAGSVAAARVSAKGDAPETFRALMGVLPDEPLPDLRDLSPERLRLLREGNFFDAFPVHVLTDTTLQTLARIAPESEWDERRFRPNVVVDADEPDGYPELGWLGRRVRVGTAVLEAAIGCPRCVMVTQPVDELPQDHRLMRTLVKVTRHTAGIYADVVEEGEVRVGDAVELQK
jgi:uncharacterized protein YcbX